MNQYYAVEISTAPTSEPITTAEARLHLRVTPTGSPLTHPDDTLIDNLVKASREIVEAHTGRAVITQTVKQYMDTWPTDGIIYLMRNPVQTPSPDTLVITYLDAAGDTKTWATTEYRVDRISIPVRITLAYGKSFPSLRGVTNSVTITFTAGYEEAQTSPVVASTVPESLIAAIMLMLGHLYEHRETVIEAVSAQEMPMSYKALIAPYIVWDF